MRLNETGRQKGGTQQAKHIKAVISAVPRL